jgi:NAD(P)-dependent dehydrogenase (short-subunit alcohol dehydrogenase family)
MKKTVLITGASSGFGKLIAQLFNRNGWNVVATMRSPQNETELNKQKNTIVTKLDVTDKESIKKAVKETINAFGNIDVLVNNAGYGASGFLEEASQQEVYKQIDTNLVGVINTIQEVLPVMREQKSGTIINITSLAGSVGMPMLSLYNASKFAVEGLSESLAFELKEFDINVKTVAPGAFKTNFMDAILVNEGNAKEELYQYRKQYKKHLKAMAVEPPKPFGYGDPMDVALKVYECATRNTPLKNFIGKDAKSVTFMRRFLSKKRFFNILYKAGIPDYQSS